MKVSRKSLYLYLDSFKRALRDSSEENSPSEEDKQRIKEFDECLENSKSEIVLKLEQFKKIFQDKTTLSLKYIENSRSFPDDSKNPIISSMLPKVEENIRKDMETILIQIYVEHIDKTQKYDLSVYAKQVKNVFKLCGNFFDIF